MIPFLVFLVGVNAAITLTSWRDRDDSWFYMAAGITACLIYALVVKLQ